jgi:type VI secretion system secreted protein VgrG
MRIESGATAAIDTSRDTRAAAASVDATLVADWAAPAARAPISVAPVGQVQIQAQASIAATPGGQAEELASAKVHLALADDVYNDTPNPPAGWRVAGEDDLARLGLDATDLEEPGSSFRARVYANADGGYVVAFRGSATAEDWGNNFKQGLGLDSGHYDKALVIGERLRTAGEDVVLTGHSLGGGLASAAAVASGLEADTFNAAGLSGDTLEAARANGAAAPHVDAYYLDGDPLSRVQDGGDRWIGAGLGGLFGGLGGGILGALLADAPPAYGDRHELAPIGPEGQPGDDASLGDLHGRAWLISSLDAAYRAAVH